MKAVTDKPVAQPFCLAPNMATSERATQMMTEFMSKTSTLDLYFSPQDQGGLYPNFCHIYVKAYTSSPRGREASGQTNYVLLTPECASPGELDEQIDRLIRELEHVRALGKRRFSAKK